MSNPDGEPSRLSEAIDDILKGSPAPRPAEPASPTPYELPTIVPATADVPILPEQAPRPVTPVAPPTPPAPPAPQAPVPRPTAVATTPIAVAASASPPPATAWGDHLPAPSSAQPGPQLRGPGRRPRVRRVTRVVRHVDPWSTFKLALVFSLVAYLVMLTSGVLLWRVADSTGTLDNIERWFTQFGWETFELRGGEIFHNAWIIGLFGAVGLTGAAVLAATLFNLVSDIVGGIRVTVLEEEVVERTASSARRYVVRRPPLGAASAAASDWNVDDPATVAPPAAVPAAGSAWSVDDDEPATRVPS